MKKIDILVNHSLDILQSHKGDGQIRPGMKAEDTTGAPGRLKSKELFILMTLSMRLSSIRDMREQCWEVIVEYKSGSVVRIPGP